MVSFLTDTVVCGFSLYHILAYFLIYSCIGWCLEVIFAAAAKNIVTHAGGMDEYHLAKYQRSNQSPSKSAAGLGGTGPAWMISSLSHNSFCRMISSTLSIRPDR